MVKKSEQQRAHYTRNNLGLNYRVEEIHNPPDGTPNTQFPLEGFGVDPIAITKTPTAIQLWLSFFGDLLEPMLEMIEQLKSTNKADELYEKIFPQNENTITDEIYTLLRAQYIGTQLHGAFALGWIMSFSNTFHLVTNKKSKQKVLPNFFLQIGEHPLNHFAINSENDQKIWADIINYYIKYVHHQSDLKTNADELQALLDYWKQKFEFNISSKGNNSRGVKNAVPIFDADQLRQRIWNEIGQQLRLMLPAVLKLVESINLNDSSDVILIEPSARLLLSSSWRNKELRKNETDKAIVEVRLDAANHFFYTNQETGQTHAKTRGLELKSSTRHYEQAIVRKKIKGARKNILEVGNLPIEKQVEFLLQLLATWVIHDRYFTANQKKKTEIKNDADTAIRQKIDLSLRDIFPDQSNWDLWYQRITSDVELVMQLYDSRTNRFIEALVVFDQVTFTRCLLYLTDVMHKLNDLETRMLLQTIVKNYTPPTSPQFKEPYQGQKQPLLSDFSTSEQKVVL